MIINHSKNKARPQIPWIAGVVAIYLPDALVS